MGDANHQYGSGAGPGGYGGYGTGYPSPSQPPSAQPAQPVQPAMPSVHPSPAKKAPIALIIGLIAALGLVGGTAYAAYWYFSGASPALAKYMPKDTQAYFEVPSFPKAMAKFAGCDVVDTKELDIDKNTDKAVDSLTASFDGLKKDDAKSLIKSFGGMAVGVRTVKKETQVLMLVSFSSSDGVEALLKTSRFSKGDKIAGGQGYELKEAKIDADKLAKADAFEKGAAKASVAGKDDDFLVWFADKKLLALGHKEMIEDAGKVMSGDKDSLASTDKFKKAKYESGAIAVGWIDSDLLKEKDDDKVKELRKNFFDDVGPFVFSGRIASGGMVLTFTGDLKGKGIPDEKIAPESGGITLQEKLPKSTLAYVAIANGKKIDAKEGKRLLVDYVTQFDKEKGKSFEQGLDMAGALVGVSYETFHDAFGGTMGFPKEEILAINASEKYTFSKETPKVDDLADYAGAELLIRVKDKEAAAVVVKALRQRVFEDGVLKDTFDVEKKDDGFVATAKKGPSILVKVNVKDDVALVLVGSKKRVDEMSDAFDGKDTLKSEKAHKLAMSSLDSKPLMLIWADTGRIMKGLLDDKAKDELKEQGIPYKALKLDGDERVTSAIAIESRYSDGGLSYRVETLNLVAMTPLGMLVGAKAVKAVASESAVETHEDYEKKEADKIAAWPSQKTKTVEGTLKGFGSDTRTPFTIELPESFQKSTAGSTETMITYEMKDDGSFLVGPSITLRSGFGPPDVEEAVKLAGMTKDKVTKKETTDKGYVVVTEGEFGIGIESAVKNGEGSLECSAHLYTEKQKAAKEQLVPWLEKVCGSLAVKK